MGYVRHRRSGLAGPHRSSPRGVRWRRCRVAAKGILLASVLALGQAQVSQAAGKISAFPPGIVGPYDTGSGTTVGIFVAASFTPATTFAEARLHIDGPAGRNFYSSRSGAPFSFDEQQWEVAISAPGSYTVYVDWATHGLGMVTARSPTAGFVIPPPPPQPRFTPQQKADLGHVSNALWKAGAIIAAGAFVIAGAVLVIGTGGLAGAGVALAFGVLGGGLAAYLAADASDLSIDPLNDDYRVIPSPTAPNLGRLTAGGVVSADASAAVNAMLAHDETVLGLMRALRIGIDRSQAAAAANDPSWVMQQLVAARTHAAAVSTLLKQEPLVRADARRALEAGGFPELVVTAQDIDTAKQAIAAEFPADMRAYLTRTGASQALIEQLRAQVLSLDPATAGGPLLDLLSPPAQGTSTDEFAALGELLDKFGGGGVGSTPPGGELVQDGGFEPPAAPAAGSGFVNLASGRTLGRWIVGSGDIDVLGGEHWTPASGHQSIDLNGVDSGSVTQQLATSAGAVYQVSFELAGNADGLPTTKALTVTFGATSRDFHFDEGSHTAQNMGWTAQSFTAIAAAATTPLTFTSHTDGPYGPAIDSVSVQPVGTGGGGGGLPCGTGY
jgi:choice-of-anchor C domain-containing protein